MDNTSFAIYNNKAKTAIMEPIQTFFLIFYEGHRSIYKRKSL